MGGDSLCYAAIDAHPVDDITTLTELTCAMKQSDSAACNVQICTQEGHVNCSFGGQRLPYELPGGWEIASAFFPKDVARGSETAISTLAAHHDFGSVALQLRDAVVATAGWPAVHGLDGPVPGGKVGDVVRGNPDDPAHFHYEMGISKQVPEGWIPLKEAQTLSTSTTNKLLIRTCPPGTFMAKYGSTGHLVHESACTVCNATTGCTKAGTVGWECHTHFGWPYTKWDGAGSVGCIGFPTHPATETECQEIVQGAGASISKDVKLRFTYASYSPVDKNCYRTLEEVIPPNLATPIGRQKTAIKSIPGTYSEAALEAGYLA